MNIIFGQPDTVKELREKYIVLELDTFRIEGVDQMQTAYCLVELSLNELVDGQNFISLHENFVKFYKQRQWKFCEDALEHLKGRWHGQLDEFYESVRKRIEVHKTQELGDDWDGSLYRSRGPAETATQDIA